MANTQFTALGSEAVREFVIHPIAVKLYSSVRQELWRFCRLNPSGTEPAANGFRAEFRQSSHRILDPLPLHCLVDITRVNGIHIPAVA